MTVHPPAAPDRTRPPPAGPIRPFHLPEPVVKRLDDGMELRILADARVPLVSGCLVLDAGEATVPAGQEGLAVLTGDALQGGTRRRSGTDLAEAIERLGTSLRSSTGWDGTTLSFTCTPERLDPTMALLAEVVREATFPEAEVDRVRRQRLAAIGQRRKDPGALADDEADRVLFPRGHPFHRPLSGTEGSVEKLGSREAREWAAERYRPGRGGLVLVGDLDPAEAAGIARTHFAGWEGQPPEPTELPGLEPRDPRPVVVVHRPGAVQAELRVIHAGPPRTHPDYHALAVANTALGGAFTSRLNLNLRERHGYTYGIRSRFVMRRRGGAFLVSTAVQTEVTAPAVREVFHELGRFVEEGPDDEEIGRTRDYLAGVFPLRMETTAQLAARVAELIIFDLPADEHHRARDRIRAVTTEDAIAAFRRHVRPGQAPIVLCADADAVRADLEALDLGPVEVLAAPGPLGGTEKDR